MGTYFFLDTNIYIHYKFFTDINWLKILGIPEAVLVIPATVMKELDEKKYNGQDQIVRERAQKIIQHLVNIISNGEPFFVNGKLQVIFLNNKLDIDWHKEGLSSSSNDDNIIASILLFIKDKPDAKVTFITGDLGSIIKCKLRKIEAIQLGSEYLLPKNDKEKKELIELKKELEKLRNALPKLSLIFKNSNEQYIGLNMKKVIPITQEQIEHKIDELEKGLVYNKPCVDPSIPSSLLAIASLFLRPSQDEFERYEKDSKIFLSKYKEYMMTLSLFQQKVQLIFALRFVLVNCGNAVAEDIDIFMHFPDGFNVLCNINDLPHKPKEPEPPARPRNLSEIIQTPLTLPSMSYLMNQPLIGTNIQKSHPIIKKVNSYEVNYTINSLKHTMNTDLDPLYIIFNRLEDIKSFEVNYRIVIRNAPEPFNGCLHVVFKNE
jgi:hypothetical protein